MTVASTTITATVDTATKAIVFSGRLSLYDSRTAILVTKAGTTWPAGDYTIAVTYRGVTVASAACTYDAGALSCTLNLNTTEMANVFNALRGRAVHFDFTLWDDTGHIEWGRARVPVYYTEWTEASPAATVSADDYYTGTTAISSGAASVTVDISNLSLTGAPQVVATVAGPAGAYNIFATVTAVTATSFVVSLSAPVPSSSYTVNWVVFP